MTTPLNISHCVICNNQEDIFECKECTTVLCFNHLTIHRDTNNKEINQFKQKLNNLKEELDKPKNIFIQQQNSTFINKIYVINSPIRKETRWKQNGITIAGGYGRGNKLNQLFHPHGIFIDYQKNIFIADIRNHRIVEWNSNAINGQIVAGGNGQGDQLNQLHGPSDVIIDYETNSLIIADHLNKRVMKYSRQINETNREIIISNIDCCGLTMNKYGSLYVCDGEKNEVRRWKRGEDNVGTLVAGGNGSGDQLNQFNRPCYIFVDEDDSIYVSDWNNHRVMKWEKDAREGIIVAGGNGPGNKLTQLSSPYGVIVDQLGQIYVADHGNDRIMCWNSESKEGRIIAGVNGKGKESDQLYHPIGLSFDFEGNLYVADWGNNRIQKFEIE